MATTNNPAVLWNTTQDIGKTGKEKARENIGASGLVSGAETHKFVTGISENSTTGELSVTKVQPTTSDLSDFSTEMDKKANKSEMSVTPGTGTDADKTTIQLKTGTSATVLTAHQTIPVTDVRFVMTSGTSISAVTNGVANIDYASTTGTAGISRLYGSISVGDLSNNGGTTPKAVSDFMEDYANVIVQYKSSDAASNFTEITEILGRGLSPVLSVPAIHAGESSSYLHLSVSQDCYFHFTEPEDKKVYVLTVDNNVNPPTYSWANYDLYAKSPEVPFLASSYSTVLDLVTQYGQTPILHTSNDRYVCNFKHREYTNNQHIYHEFYWHDTEMISYNLHTGEIHHEYEIYNNPNGGPYAREHKSGFIPVVLEESGGNYTCNYTYSELLAFYQDGIRFSFYIDDASIYSGSLSGVGDICTTTFSYTTDQGGVKWFDFIFPYVYTQQGGNIVKTLRWSVDSNNVWSFTQQTAT